MISRKCSDCKELKELENFSNYKRDKIFGKKKICKECDRARSKSYYSRNLDKEKKRRRLKYLKNRDRELQSCDTYKRNRKINDPEFKLICNLRDRHRKAVKIAGAEKNFRSSRLLGCSALELRNYFESLFKNDMNWNNYGKVWNIDHIYPLSKVDWNNAEEVSKACHYTNLKPEYCSVNFSKGNKFTF
jgi:hypothetical protein